MFKKLNNKRGFSLVELMVVVAIMGVLASIAIPAFNNYRTSAKKTAYKSDLTALHKGWQAFGVELDSYCERETTPQVATFSNVGMSSLVNSKLYGARGVCDPPASLPGACTNAMCEGATGQTACGNVNDGAATPVACNCSWNSTGGTGPGKHNFIGFGSNHGTNPCTGVTGWDLDNVRILGEQGGTGTSAPSGCAIGITAYEMGVYGHVRSNDAYGTSINQSGVVTEAPNSGISTIATTPVPGC